MFFFVFFITKAHGGKKKRKKRWQNAYNIAVGITLHIQPFTLESDRINIRACWEEWLEKFEELQLQKSD